MKNKLQRILASLFALSLLTCPALAASSFPDVPDSAAYAEAAEYLNEAGIMQGDSQGNFNPDKSVTRAQMAAILCRLMGETENLEKDGSFFADVPTTYWANDAIVEAVKLGIISGYQDGTFRPDNTVSYAQAITMVVRTMGLEDLAIAAGGYPDGYISLAKEKGLAGTFSAASNDALTRWQVADILFCVYT